jgi:hypothetical protein
LNDIREPFIESSYNNKTWLPDIKRWCVSLPQGRSGLDAIGAHGDVHWSNGIGKLAAILVMLAMLTMQWIANERS